MALKKDKEKVLDEVWTEDRVKEFLNVQAATGVDADFHVLLKAYQSMRIENFEQFVGFFIADGRNINAAGPDGNTVLAIVGEHREGQAYSKILADNGAS